MDNRQIKMLFTNVLNTFSCPYGVLSTSMLVRIQVKINRMLKIYGGSIRKAAIIGRKEQYTTILRSPSASR